ncbi:MAG: hypothetical protein JF593_05055 [Novosphingobium sp.]|nr:hypothetical protein [Novosphingobium sp.]
MTRQGLPTCLLLAATTVLSACGADGGGGVASSPPPVPTPTAPAPIVVVSQELVNRTPLPASVATIAGTYDTIAWVSKQTYDLKTSGTVLSADVSGIASPSPFKITVDPANHAFTLAGQFSDGRVQRTYVGDSGPALRSTISSNQYYGDFGNQFDINYHFSDGTKSDPQHHIQDLFIAETHSAAPDSSELFHTEMGLRYVSYGNWAFDEYATEQATGTRYLSQSTSATFVYGEHTPPSDLPVSGMASYADAGRFLQLDADFGARSVTAYLDYPAKIILTDGYDGGEGTQVQVGFRATGSASISSAAGFVIPLSGTSATPDPAGTLPDAVAPVTGSFAGAFFGPRAAEAGGLVSLVDAAGKSISDWTAVPFLLEHK